VEPQLCLADTNCLIALLQSWHQHHHRTAREFDRRIARGARLVVAAHSLAEAYSVLTRLPEPFRTPPVDARSAIFTSIVGNAEVAALSVDAYLRLLQSAPDRNILGGRIYDALIVACAVEAGADVLLTFNERRFVDLAPPSLRIVVPG
jgi:predicted nucleic acid-binding protein